MTTPNRNYYLSIVLLSLFAPYSWATLQDAISTEATTQQQAATSQKKIDTLNHDTRELLGQYRNITYQTDILLANNKHLTDLIASQNREKISITAQLKQITTTQQEIVPLILQMLASLETIIQLDLPFLLTQRQERLINLQKMMVRADVTNAEKFRRIIEAYQIENDYGNTIEAYRGDLDFQGVSSVNFLRLGRVALYYQSLDGEEVGFWNANSKKWQVLDNDYRASIGNGLRIARKESAPDLLVLPIPAAKDAR